MALQENIETVSYVADDAIDQYLVVAHDANPRGCTVSDGTTAPLGVSLNKTTAAGQALAVVIGGIAKVKAGGVIAAGAPVGADATGRVSATLLAGGALGTAITAATAAGEVIEVQL